MKYKEGDNVYCWNRIMWAGKPMQNAGIKKYKIINVLEGDDLLKGDYVCQNYDESQREIITEEQLLTIEELLIKVKEFNNEDNK